MADAGFQLQQAGQVGVAVDLAFHGAGMQFQLALAVIPQVADARLFAEVIAGKAEAQHAQEQQQEQQQQVEQARFHGQCGRHGAEAGGGALHHSHPGLASRRSGAERAGWGP
ncbi:hypothetical protein D3C81_1864030 [compost metagenome]